MKFFNQAINNCISFLIQFESEELKKNTIFFAAGLILLAFLSSGYIVFKRREYKIRIEKITKMQNEINNLIKTFNQIEMKTAISNKVINDNKSKFNSVDDLIKNAANKFDIKFEDGWEKKVKPENKKSFDNKLNTVIELTTKNIHLEQIYQFIDFLRDEPYLVIRNLKIQSNKDSLSANIKITYKRA